MKKYLFILILASALVSPAGAQWNPDTLTALQMTDPFALAVTTQGIIPNVPNGPGGFIGLWSITASGPVDSLYAQSIDASGNRLWGARGVKVAPYGMINNSPKDIDIIPVPSSGGAIIAWTDDLGEIRAQKLSTSGVPLWGGGNGIRPDSAADGWTSSRARAIPDNADGAWIFWAEEVVSGIYGVYAQHVSSAGVKLSGEDGILVTQGEGVWQLAAIPEAGEFIAAAIHRSDTLRITKRDASGTMVWTRLFGKSVMTGKAARLQPDGAGNVYVTAVDSATGDSLFIEKRSITTGDAVWTAAVYAGGIPIDENYRLLSDASGVLYFVSKHGGLSNQIKAIKVNADGSPGFAITAYTSPVSGLIGGVSVLPDGAGGLIIAWEEDKGSGSSHIYGQRVTSAGSLGWTAGGKTLANIIGLSQSMPFVQPDGIGGMYLAFNNYSNFTPLAVRVRSDGSRAGVFPPSNLRFARQGSGLLLSWSPSPGPSLQNYRVVQGSTPAFNPATAGMVGAPVDTVFLANPTGLGNDYYFSVAAVSSSNEISAYTNIVNAVPLAFERSGWEPMTPLPTGLQQHAMVALNDSLYEAGGFNSSSSYENSLRAYGPGLRLNDGSWISKMTMGMNQAQAALAVFNNMLFSVGGYNGSAAVAMGNKYDAAVDSWTSMASMDSARQNFGYAVAGSFLFVAGGTDGISIWRNMQAYDMVNNTWSTKSPLPKPLVGHRMASANGLIYVFGGQGPDSSMNRTIYRYSPTPNTWDSLIVMLPTARRNFGIAEAGSDIYLVGGLNQAGQALDVAEIFDSATSTWTHTNPLPVKRNFPAMAHYGPGFVVSGGSDGVNPASANVYFLYPNPIFVDLGDKVKGIIGDTLHIPVYIDGNLSADSIFSLEIGVTFSAAMFDTVSPTPGTLASQFTSAMQYNQRTGGSRDTLYLVFASTSRVTGSGRQLLADMNLKVMSGTTGQADSLLVSRSIFNEGKPFLFRQPGTVRVQPILGDINGNRYGDVTPDDASLVLQWKVRKPTAPLTALQLERANVSGLMGVTAYDASLINQYAAGLITAFPAEAGYSPAKAAPQVGPEIAVTTDILYGVPEDEFAGGNSIAVSLSMKNIRELFSADLEFRYSAEHYQFAGIRPAEELAGFQVSSNDMNGTLYVSLAGSEAVAPDGEVLRMYFTRRGPAQDESFSIASLVINETDVTGYIASAGVPSEFMLSQNYPNPFNPVTRIQYHLPEAGEVALAIYNMLGQEVKRLVQRPQQAGYYTILWDGTNNSGLPVASGVYLYHLKTGSYIQTKKMMLLR